MMLRVTTESEDISEVSEKNMDVIHICHNNQSFGKTGHHRASLTPRIAYTSTTPLGKVKQAKNMPIKAASHRIPHVATACPSFPIDFPNKVQRA
ncbi:MAG: thiamine pyrophosphate-dependent enzyme [Euryarchaeota archaeon]|nr:thiamine pyrophosphate-dependent enzyme [Euryarchaeota archaeon]